MKILVTGGAGFIGSHLVDRLINSGYQVVVVDNLSTGKKENLNKRAKFYRLDLRSPILEKIFAKERPDYVNHHAAQIDVRASVANPIFDAQVNIIGTLNLLENCIKYKVKRFIFASSGGVIYGEAARLPAWEDYPIQPQSPYGVSKYTVERYLYYYRETYGLDYVSLRYGNVYGPRQDPSGEAGVVAIFINQMLSNKNPTIFGDGEQLRDYIYISDVVEANMLALSNGGGQALNIGTGIGTSVNTLFRRLREIVGFKGEPIYGPVRKGELLKNYLDASKAKDILGWRPRLNLEEGLNRTVEYFKSLRRLPQKGSE